MTFSFSFFLQSHQKFFVQIAFEFFEIDSSFKDNHIIVSCILRQAQFKIFVFVLIDFEASIYVFIDKIFAQFRNLLLHFLAYFRRFRKFDDQIVRIENITHVIYIIIILKIYVKRLFLYVIDFNQYFIIMNFFLFRRHEIHASFEFNIFIMFSFFNLFYCCSVSVKIQKITRKKKEFLICQKFQRI